MGADRDNAIRRIVQQSLADVRKVQDAIVEFDPEDAVHLVGGGRSPLRNANIDFDLSCAVAEIDHAEWGRHALALIRQRVAALPLEPAE